MIALRDYRATDLTAVIDLFRETVHRVNARDYTAEQLAAWAPEQIDAQAWHTRLSGAYTFIAVDGETVVGFASLEDNGYLDTLFVHHDRQRQGIARRLLAAAEKQARNLKLSSLRTDASLTARPFFEGHGFIPRQEQDVRLRGQTLRNVKMEKSL